MVKVKIEIYGDDNRPLYRNVFITSIDVARRVIDLLNASINKKDVQEEDFSLDYAIIYALSNLGAYSIDNAVEAWDIAKFIINDEKLVGKAIEYYGVKEKRELLTRLSRAIGPTCRSLARAGIVGIKKMSRGRVYWLNKR